MSEFSYAVELKFKDERGEWVETDNWYGSARGFDSYYSSIDKTYHPSLVAKRAVVVEAQEDKTDWEDV